jgi:cholesterol oxidase
MIHLPCSTGSNIFIRLRKVLISLIKSPIKYLKIYFMNSWAKTTVVLLFMQTLDSTLRFKINILGFMNSTISTGKKPTPFIPESVILIKEYSKAVNDVSTSFALETIVGIASKAHILGGAVMGENPSKAVIDKNNKAFGYENLYIINGSMISENPKVTPSLSITASAERAMDQIPFKNT